MNDTITDYDPTRSTNLDRAPGNGQLRLTDTDEQTFTISAMTLPDLVSALEQADTVGYIGEHESGRITFGLENGVKVVEAIDEEPGEAWITMLGADINSESEYSYNIKSKTHLKAVRSAFEFYNDRIEPHTHVSMWGVESWELQTLFTFLTEKYSDTRNSFQYESCERVVERHCTEQEVLFSEEQELVEHAIQSFEIADFPVHIQKYIEKVYGNIENPSVEFVEVEE